MADATLHPAETPAARPWYRRRWWLWPLLLICLLVVYYVGGMLWLHTIDDDPDFGLQSSAPEGGSQAVAVAADLIDREINVHRWVANDPFFLPGSLLDNMPEFQQGIVAAISRFSLELTDQVGRTRGSSQADADLDRAAGLLRYPGTIWIFDFRTSLAPTASSSSSTARRWRRCAATTSASARARPCSRHVPTTCSARSTGSRPTSALPRPRLTNR